MFSFLPVEEPEEDEEDENTEESEEEDSEEDLNETPIPAPTRPPYSLIPPPPVWVQRNQGLSERILKKHTHTCVHAHVKLTLALCGRSNMR